MKNKRGLLLVVSGPSGAGKGTICNKLLSEYPEFEVSISATTRNPREGEKDGVNYFFITKEEFIKRRDEEKFVEWTEFCGNFYGTLKSEVERILNSGKDLILEIEVNGALNVKKIFPEAILFFAVPPNASELRARLSGRGTETEDIIEKRLKTAEWEFTNLPNYDYLLLNDTVEKAVERFMTIVNAERQKVTKNSGFAEEFFAR